MQVCRPQPVVNVARHADSHSSLGTPRGARRKALRCFQCGQCRRVLLPDLSEQGRDQRRLSGADVNGRSRP